jgi:hypothetical protein
MLRPKEFFVTYNRDPEAPKVNYYLPDGRVFSIMVLRSPEDNGILIEIDTRCSRTARDIEPTKEKMRIWLNEKLVEDNR